MVGSVWRVLGRSSGRRVDSMGRLGYCWEVNAAGEVTIGEPISLIYNSGVDG